jgi:hypothetical protein
LIDSVPVIVDVCALHCGKILVVAGSMMFVHGGYQKRKAISVRSLRFSLICFPDKIHIRLTLVMVQDEAAVAQLEKKRSQANSLA